MKRISQPKKRIFWDNCVWSSLFQLCDNPNLPKEIERRARITRFMSGMAGESVGVVFSPILFADVNKNVALDQFERELSKLEEYGFVTRLEPSSDWTGVATLRSNIRRDIETNPLDFASLASGDLRKLNVGFGDTAVIYAALRTGCDELWTYDATLLALSERACVRNLKIVEPHPIVLQTSLFDQTELT